MATELFQMKLSANTASGLYFHDKTTDILYKLKDTYKQSQCGVFGLKRELHLTEDDLIKKGTLKAFRKNNPFLFMIPCDSINKNRKK